MASNVTALLKGRWVVWGLSLFFSVLAGLGVFLIVGKAADRTPIYVMSEDVPARTQITSANVLKVDVNAEAQPVTALSYADVASGKLFTAVPLKRGDILTTSVTAGLTPINYKLPPRYLTASIQVAPERAVGGKIKRGDYIDIAAVTGTTSKVVLQHVLVLDVTVNPNSIASAANDKPNSSPPGPESQQVRGGIPQVYTLAVTARDFAKLALVGDSKVWLALSSYPVESSLTARVTLPDVFAPGPVPDSGAGTGKVFTDDPTPAPAPTAVPTVPASPAPVATPSVPAPAQP